MQCCNARPPSLLARPSRFPRAQNPLSLPFQTPATQARHLHTYISPTVRSLYESPAPSLYRRAIAVVLKKKKKNKRPTNSRGGGIISMSFHDSALHFFPNWNFSSLAKAPFSTTLTKNQIDHTTKVVCPWPSPGFIGFWRSLSFDLPSQPFWMKRQKNGCERE